MVRVKSKPKNTIDVGDLEEGQLAIISKWPAPYYSGLVVIRHKNSLVGLGEKGKYWTCIFIDVNAHSPDYQLTVLEPGTELIVE